MQQNKKIIIVSNVIWSISTFRRYLIQELVEQGYKVVCIADQDDFSENSINIVTSLGASYIRIPLNRQGLNPLTDFFYLIKLIKLYKKEKPDLIMHYSIKPIIYGSFASWIIKIPSFAILTGLGSSFIKQGIITKIILFLYKLSLSKVTKIFFLNESDKKIFSFANAYILPGEGIDTQEYDKCDPVPNTNTRFILIARLLKDKGVYEYIEAAKVIKTRYKKVEFLLAGDFDNGNPSAIEPDEVNTWITEKTIHYLGKTDNIKEFLSLADIVVLPSYREGLSRVLLEAASCKRAIITTDVPGCRELVKDGYNGFLCEKANAESLIQAIERIMQLSKDARQKLGENGRELVVNNYRKEDVNNIMIKAIKEVVK